MISRNDCKKSSQIKRDAVEQWSVGLPLIGRLIPWFQLMKLPVCLLISFSTLFGFILANTVDLGRALLAWFGMLCLSCGGAALNSLQEIHLDASMIRTRQRPLPTGRIRSGPAAVLVVLLMMVGIWIFCFPVSSPVAASLGGVAVFFYNLIYTNLKTKTLMAIIPGAISGALPPYIGWVAGGGPPFSITALLLFVLFVLWQVPHSFLILLNHREDYKNHAIHSLVKFLSESSLKRLFLVWTATFFCVLLVFFSFFIQAIFVFKILMWIGTCLFFVACCIQLACQDKNDYYYLFIQLNGYLFTVMALFIGVRLLS